MGNWVEPLKRFVRNKKAISGLETAIVLIAFVIVASAFGYAVLNMGFLATQKSQQVVLGGLAVASSALVVDGPVYGYSDQTPSSNDQLTSIVFWLQTASGAGSVDLNPGKTMISFQNPRGVWPNVYYCSDGTGNQNGACPGKDVSGNPATPTSTCLAYTPVVGGSDYWTLCGATNVVWEVGTGMLLQSGQRVRVTIDLTELTSSPGNLAGGNVGNDEAITIIVKPPSGSVLEIDRVAPATIQTVNDLG
ncbi:MAG TPA: archaellin/type IV pilin N-terminal domain-containing protein [Candidatus Acidoferrales bacterium]|nr:archaellin/type IV pilin N-terminal domain-containing protein [Candidatus Acidoferrales bacterium]